MIDKNAIINNSYEAVMVDCTKTIYSINHAIDPDSKILWLLFKDINKGEIKKGDKINDVKPELLFSFSNPESMQGLINALIEAKEEFLTTNNRTNDK